MHKYIMKRLPKFESEIIALAKEFENEHGKKMRILGEDIPAMIEKEWKALKEEKCGKKTGRGNLSPVKCALQVMKLIGLKKRIAFSNNFNSKPITSLLQHLI